MIEGRFSFGLSYACRTEYLTTLLTNTIHYYEKS